MSILIKGVTKPTDCILCPMFRGAWQMCGLLNREVHPKGTPKNCPMVELPPHGRLIDADIAEVIVTDEKDEVGGFLDGILYAADWIANQPTVIEAEEVSE